jgi:hypothetical protein
MCRRIFVDRYTGDTLIFGPLHELASASFPMVAELAFFGRWLSVHGAYEISVQLQDLEGNVIWGEKQDRLLECPNPLVVTVLTLQPLHIFFPRPGKYEIVILANNQEVVRDVFWVHLPQPPAPEPQVETD